jgi:hypothetical protein
MRAQLVHCDYYEDTVGSDFVRVFYRRANSRRQNKLSNGLIFRVELPATARQYLSERNQFPWLSGQEFESVSFDKQRVLDLNPAQT